MRRSGWKRARGAPEGEAGILRGYVVAVLASLGALLFTLALWPALTQTSFIFFFGAVALGAWYGLGPGLVATALGGAASAAMVVARLSSVAVSATEDIIRLWLFVLVAIAISAVGDARRRSQAHAEEARDELRATLTSIADAVITTDSRGRVTFINPTAEALTGWTSGDAVGQPLHGVFAVAGEQATERMETLIDRVLEEGEIVSLADHAGLRARDGAERPIDDTAAPIRDAKGRVIGVVLVFRASTEPRRIEREPAEREALVQERQARAKADAATRIKDEFLASVSHELRTPLNAIVGWLHMLRRRALDPGTADRAVDVALRNAEALKRLVEDLQDVAGIVTGTLRIERRPTELTPIVVAAVESVRPTTEGKGIKLQMQLASRSLPVMADADRLQQIFWRLMTHAATLTEAGGSIDVTVTQEQSQAVVRVVDTGRASSPGLGLALVREVVERHGGSVEAPSEGEGPGSTVTVRLPILVP